MIDLRARLEAAIDAAIALGPSAAVDDAIALLDAIDGDADLENTDFEEPETPPLMDGGWGYGLGRLPVYAECRCCGHRELECFALPVIKVWEGQTEAVL